MTICKGNSIYNCYDSKDINFIEVKFKKQAKYANISDFSVKLNYDLQNKLIQVVGYFAVSSTLTANYNSSDIGGATYWPALFYIDDLPDEFFEIFQSQSKGCAIYTDSSKVYCYNLIPNSISKVIAICFSTGAQFTNTSTTINICPSMAIG